MKKREVANRPFGLYIIDMTKKEEIIKKAEEIISNEGLDSFSLSHLAQETGLAKATLYHYFKSKDEILSSIFNLGHKNFMKMGFVVNLNNDIYTVLRDASSHWIKIFTSYDNQLWLRIIFSLYLTNDDAYDEYKSISLMLHSQSQVIISSLSLTQTLEETMTELFYSFLFHCLERSLSEEDLDIDDEMRKIATLIEKIKKN